MTNTISETLALIINIENVIIHHKKTCNDNNCNVSIHQLILTAKQLSRKLIESSEQIDAAICIEKMYHLL